MSLELREGGLELRQALLGRASIVVLPPHLRHHSRLTVVVCQLSVYAVRLRQQLQSFTTLR
jgi:hypothetical protein